MKHIILVALVIAVVSAKSKPEPKAQLSGGSKVDSPRRINANRAPTPSKLSHDFDGLEGHDHGHTQFTAGLSGSGHRGTTHHGSSHHDRGHNQFIGGQPGFVTHPQSGVSVGVRPHHQLAHSSFGQHQPGLSFGTPFVGGHQQHFGGFSGVSNSLQGAPIIYFPGIGYGILAYGNPSLLGLGGGHGFRGGHRGGFHGGRGFALGSTAHRGGVTLAHQDQGIHGGLGGQTGHPGFSQGSLQPGLSFVDSRGTITGADRFGERTKVSNPVIVHDDRNRG